MQIGKRILRSAILFLACIVFVAAPQIPAPPQQNPTEQAVVAIDVTAGEIPQPQETAPARTEADWKGKSVAIDNKPASTREIAAFQDEYQAFVQPYFRNRLPQEELWIYDTLYYAYSTGAHSVTFANRIDPDRLYLIGQLLACDYPQFSTNLFREVDTMTDLSNSVYENVMADSFRETVAQNAAALPKARELVGQIPADLTTQREKAAYLYDYVTHQFAYEAGDEYRRHSTFASAFEDGHVLCEGYASTVQVLFNLAGIECVKLYYNTEYGDGKEGHSWNLAKIDGDYYQFDATFERSLVEAGLDRRVLFGMTEQNALQSRAYAVELRELLPVCTNESLQSIPDYACPDFSSASAAQIAALVRRAGKRGIWVAFSGEIGQDAEQAFGQFVQSIADHMSGSIGCDGSGANYRFWRAD